MLKTPTAYMGNRCKVILLEQKPKLVRFPLTTCIFPARYVRLLLFARKQSSPSEISDFQ